MLFFFFKRINFSSLCKLCWCGLFLIWRPWVDTQCLKAQYSRYYLTWTLEDVAPIKLNPLDFFMSISLNFWFVICHKSSLFRWVFTVMATLCFHWHSIVRLSIDINDSHVILYSFPPTLNGHSGYAQHYWLSHGSEFNNIER